MTASSDNVVDSNIIFDSAILKAPNKTLNDILCYRNSAMSLYEQSLNVTDINVPLSKDKVSPVCICDGWLFLGDAQCSTSYELLTQLGITHILNVTDSVPNYFMNKKNNGQSNHGAKTSIQYARIPFMDTKYEQMYDYFECAALFIDQCNPHRPKSKTENNNKRKYKCLIHCSAGISRSVTIALAYLISRCVVFNEKEKATINEIRYNLYKNEFANVRKRMFQNDKQHKQRIIDAIQRHKIKKRNFLTLSEAYYFVLSKKPTISPNVGFMQQLISYERFLQHSSSILYLPSQYKTNLQMSMDVKSYHLSHQMSNSFDTNEISNCNIRAISYSDDNDSEHSHSEHKIPPNENQCVSCLMM